MLRSRLSTIFGVALLILITSLTSTSTSAQDVVDLDGIYPARGELDTEVNLLLRGHGFEGVGRLQGVYISGVQVPLNDYAPVSDEFIRVLFYIPPQTRVGVTEISFRFDNWDVDHDFVVFQGEDQDIMPEIHHLEPQDGLVDTEMALYFEGTRLFELGELGGVIIGDVQIPVLNDSIESDESMFIDVYLPPETPLGETEVGVFFENYSFVEFFFVRGLDSEGPEDIVLYDFSPREALVDTEVELHLEGENLYQLARLVSLVIAGSDIPVLYYAADSNESMVIQIYLPPDLATGATEISFYFENYEFEDAFLVRGPDSSGPEDIILFGFSPREALLDSEVELNLEGENLSRLGRLDSITIAGFDVPILRYVADSDQSMVIGIYLPPDLETGETELGIYFENYSFEDSFFLRGREPGPVEPGMPELWGLDPQQGDVDSEIELLLQGANLFGLGELVAVRLNEVDIPVLDYEIESDESLLLRLYLPEGTAGGDGTIAILFENAELVEDFFVSVPTGIPIGPLIGVIVVVVTAILGLRYLRGRRTPTERPEEKPSQPQAEIDFIVSVDTGTQIVEQDGPSLTMEIELRFEVDFDPGVQSVETDGDSLIDHG